MRVTQQPGFVLHQHPHSETSLLLEGFTAEHGRVGLLAKGARRPGNRARGYLKPFQPLLLGWSGRGELPVLTSAEPQDPAPELYGEALYCGFYVNELLVRLLHRHDPHPGLYQAYRACLSALQPGAANESVLRLFEKRLLAEIGFGLVLDRDIGDNSPVAADAVYDYVLDRGPVRLNPERYARTQGVRVHGASLAALACDTLDSPMALRDAKLLMRAVLARHLGDRPLHSRELFKRPVAIGSVTEAAPGHPGRSRGTTPSLEGGRRDKAGS
jgi:DNA repair protein RecO (recombination protein O)